ncbi:MAG: metallophosphoesterase [Coprobacillaceae bacterium]
MFILFIILFLVLIALLSGYSYYHITQMLPTHRHVKKIAIGIVILLYVLMWIHRLFMGFFLNACIVFIIFDVISLLVYRFKTVRKYWLKVYQKGFTVLGVSILLSLYGIYNVQNIEITTYTISLSKEMEDKTVVMATDMHISTAVGKEELDTFVEETKRVDPDMIFLVGDIYDESSKDKDIEYSYTIFEELTKEYPVYFVSGNHEVGQGAGGVLESKNIKAKLKDIGIQVLDDETIELEDMYLIGRQDATITKRKSLDKIVNGLKEDKAKIVLDHQPTDYENSKKLKMDLVVSGHTHGGQLFPVGLFDSLLKVNDLNYGYIEEGDFNAVVSSGMGTWGFAMRTSRQCEIVILNIQGEK